MVSRDPFSGEAVKLEDEAELPELDAVSFLEVSKRSCWDLLERNFLPKKNMRNDDGDCFQKQQGTG